MAGGAESLANNDGLLSKRVFTSTMAQSILLSKVQKAKKCLELSRWQDPMIHCLLNGMPASHTECLKFEKQVD